MAMSSSLKIATCAIAIVLSSFANAQDRNGREDQEEIPGASGQYEAGFHLGNLLPNQIDGVTEIIGLGGVRAGYRLGKTSFVETGLIMGNGSGAKWKNYHIDIRLDLPIEGMLALAYVGADSVLYEGRGQSSQLIFGGHAGGGIMAHISGIAWFRADMKFGISPGTSLYIGAGLEFRFGEAAQGGGTQ